MLYVLRKKTKGASVALKYMEQFKTKVPVVYGRLAEHAKKNNVLKWWDFNKNRRNVL